MILAHCVQAGAINRDLALREELIKRLEHLKQLRESEAGRALAPWLERLDSVEAAMRRVLAIIEEDNRQKGRLF